MGKNKRPLTPLEKFGIALFEHATLDDSDIKPLQGLYKPFDQYTNEDIVRVSFHNKPQFKAILEHVSLERRVNLLWQAVNQ